MRASGNLSFHFDTCTAQFIPCRYGPVRVLRTREDLDWLQSQVDALPDSEFIALDLEAWSPVSIRGESTSYFQQVQVLLTALSVEPHWRAVILHNDSEVPTVEWLRVPVRRTIAVYHAAYDVRILYGLLGELPPRYIDAMILAGLLSAGRIPEQTAGSAPASGDRLPGHGLADMVALFLQLPMEKELRSAFSGRSGVLVDDQLIAYAAEDAAATWWLTASLLERVRDEQILSIAQLEHRLSSCLLHMSMHGIRIDEQEVRRYARELRDRIGQMRRQLLELLRQDVWTAVGPAQPDHPAAEADLAPLLEPIPPRVRNGKETVGASVRYLLHHTHRPPMLRMSHLADLVLRQPNAQVTVFKRPNQPDSGTVTCSALQALRLDSPSWMTDHLRYLSGNLLRNTKAQQVQSYSNSISQKILLYISEIAPYQLAARLGDLLLEYRGLTKLMDSFIEPWLDQHIVRRDGVSRIYTTFSQTRARSGRIISQNPNMQNIARPRSLVSEDGLDLEIDLRAAVVADEGYLLVTADYSQYELRVAAERADEPGMIDLFQRAWDYQQQLEQVLAEHGISPWEKARIDECKRQDDRIAQLIAQIKDCDLHRWVASLVFGKPQSEISSQERTVAKAVSFGVLYGMGAPSLSQRLHAMGLQCSISEAESILESYFKSFPRLVQYIQDVQWQMLQYGYTASLIGRKRWILPMNPALEPPDRGPFVWIQRAYKNREAARIREMFNHTIQGVNADAIKLAIVYLYESLVSDPVWELAREHPVLTIHDELVVQTRADRAHAMARLVLTCMTRASRDAGLVRVPTVVELNISNRWSK